MIKGNQEIYKLSNKYSCPKCGNELIKTGVSKRIEKEKNE